MTQNITTALSVCPKAEDRATPKPIADLATLASKVAGHGPAPIADLIDELVHSTPETWDDTLDRISFEYARRQFLAHARTNGISAALEARKAEVIVEALPDAVARLHPVFTAAVKALTTAARTLPAGADALDPARVLEADAGSAFHAARDALATLTTIANVHHVRLRGDGSTPRGSELVAVVTIPRTEVQLMHPISEMKLNDPAVLEVNVHVRRLVSDYSTAPTLALLDVVRGAYGPDVTLDLANTPEDVAARVERIASAHLSKRVREHEAARA